MPKNKGKGGKKFRKFKKNNNHNKDDFVYKQEHEYYGQQYAMVTKILGHGRLNAICEDGKTRLCSISGKLKKRKTNGFIISGDIILISVRPFKKDLADVIHKYSKGDVHEFLLGKIATSDNFKKIITGISDSNKDDIIFQERDYMDKFLSSDDDDYDIDDNNNLTIEYSDNEEESKDIFDQTKDKSHIVDKKLKTKDKRNRKKNWKTNYMNNRDNEVDVNDL